MADLGAIGQALNGPEQETPGTSHWSTSYTTGKTQAKLELNTQEGRISGTAQVAGVAAPGHAVMLIERSTRRLLRTTYAGAAGAFQFDGLNLLAEDYMVLMMDEDDTGSYNSKTADRVTAIDV